MKNHLQFIFYTHLFMKNLFFCLLICSSSFLYAQQKDYPIQAVPFTQVKLTDNFWLPRIEINRTVTIPASFERCQSTGRVKNFVMAAEKKGKFCTTFPFDDTDIYKTLEGAAFSLAVHPDAKLDAYLDSLITIIGKAQEPDGYLYTARTIDPNAAHAFANFGSAGYREHAAKASWPRTFGFFRKQFGIG